MRVEAWVYAYNQPSIALLKKHGFLLEGVLKKAAYKDGKFTDSWVFGLTRDMVPGVPEWAGDVKQAAAAAVAEGVGAGDSIAVEQREQGDQSKEGTHHQQQQQ